MGKRIQITESQLSYIIKNSGKVSEQFDPAKAAKAAKARQSKTVAQNNQVSQNTDDVKEKGNKLASAKTSGQMVVMQDVEYKTEEIKFDPLDANFYANFVTLETGLRSEDLATLKSDIEGLKNMLVTNGYDLNNTTVDLIGTASSEDATETVPQELRNKGITSLDHDYGGGQADNIYLAQSRAQNIGKLITKMIPGIKVNPKSEVSSCSGRSCRFINLKIKGGKKTKDILTIPKVTFALSDQSGYRTTNEWNKKMAESCNGQIKFGCCQIQDAKDDRVDGNVISNKQRSATFGINPIGGGGAYPQSVTWVWFRKNTYQTFMGKKTFGPGDGREEVSCKSPVGSPNITSNKLNDSTGGGDGGIIKLLTTSGHFSEKSAKAVAYYIKRATPFNLNAVDPKNPFDLMRKDGVKITNTATHEQFKTFLSYCQKAGMTVFANPDKDDLVAAGAIIVNPEGKVISS